ncbi:MAG: hypothetical protein K8R23_09160 [Chthoniobacter sp.]|nr:hypothetical protein [Chthoniobacter sp.]
MRAAIIPFPRRLSPPLWTLQDRYLAAPGLPKLTTSQVPEVTLQRAKALLAVLRGDDPNGTSKRNTVARWKAGETIMSGQIMHLEWNSTDGVDEWVKGWNPSTQPLAIPHFSRYDYTDSLVTSSGLLSGISCLDDYELQTAYFTASDDYLHGSYLISDTSTAGNVKIAAGTNGAGAVGAAVIARVSKGNGPIDVRPFNSGVTPDGDGKVLVLQVQTCFQRNAVPA